MLPESSDIWARDEVIRRVREALAAGSLAALHQDIEHQCDLRGRIGSRKWTIRRRADGRVHREVYLAVLSTGLFSTLLFGWALHTPGDWAAAGLFLLVFVIQDLDRLRAPAREFDAESLRVSEGRCAACAFNLAGLPRPLAGAGVGQDRLGPERCPECGLVWPLLPRMASERGDERPRSPTPARAATCVAESPRVWSRGVISWQVRGALTSQEARDSFLGEWAYQRKLRDAAGNSPVALHSSHAPWPVGAGANAPLRAVFVLCGVLAAISLFIGFATLTGSAAPWVGAGALVMVLMAYGHARVRGYKADVARTRSGACARCGFSLGGLPGVVDDAGRRFDELGPERCPECGLLWPAVPRLRSEQREAPVLGTSTAGA